VFKNLVKKVDFSPKKRCGDSLNTEDMKKITNIAEEIQIIDEGIQILQHLKVIAAVILYAKQRNSSKFKAGIEFKIIKEEFI
jgi:hypothetical protein